MRSLFPLIATLLLRLFAQEFQPRSFQVRYVAAEAIYLNGGRESGLAEGFRLTLKRIAPGQPELDAPTVAHAVVVSIAAQSAVCEIRSTEKDFEVQVGDAAFLHPEDTEVMRMMLASRSARRFAQVVSFSEGDPLEEEVRVYVPRPPLPEINRFSGRVGLEYNSIGDPLTHNSGSSQTGAIVRADVTRIGGSYWNFSGYFRTRMNARHSNDSTQTLTDLINRTYHIGVFYNNPQSRYVMGFGRLLLPWANSLNTIDGGYLGYRLSRRVTAGVFGGSTPDPSAWNYAPGRQMAGALLNFEAGSYEGLRYSGTGGLAMTRRNWLSEREFLFFENNLLAGRKFSVFHNLEADNLRQGRFGTARNEHAITRSFLTARYQPLRFLTLDLNHNYFRGVPTFDLRLIGTGLLDKFLFQGLSGGVRLDLPYGVAVYSSVGRSQRESDRTPSWNQTHGITIQNFFESGLRIDVRGSRFNSSFGSGEYYSATLSRELPNHLRVEAQAGKQNFSSAYSGQNRALYFSSSLDWFFGRNYWVGLGGTLYRGRIQNYDQYFVHTGYRF